MTYLEAFKRIKHAIGIHNPRGRLDAILIHEDRNTDQRSLVTSDGLRLSVALLNSAHRPLAKTIECRQIPKLKTEDAAVRFFIESADRAGTYPDWERVVPSSKPIVKIEVLRKEVIAACKQIKTRNDAQYICHQQEHAIQVAEALIAATTCEIAYLKAAMANKSDPTFKSAWDHAKHVLKTKRQFGPSKILGVLLNVKDDGTVQLSSPFKTDLSMSSSLTRRYGNVEKPARFGVNADYVIDALTALRGKTHDAVSLEVYGEYEPIIFRSLDGTGFELIMPMRIP